MKRIVFSGLTGLALVSLGALNTNAANVIVTVKDSDGNPLSGVTVQQYGSGWTNFGTTDGNGVSSKLLNGNYRISVSYNHTGYQTATINFPSGNGDYHLEFYTTGVTLTTYESNGTTPVQGVTGNYYAGGYRNFAASDANGQTKLQLFPGSLSFTSSYKHTSYTRSIAVGGDAVTANQTTSNTAYLTKVKVKATSHNNVNVSGVANTYYSGGTRTFGTTNANGEVEAQLFPGTLNQFTSSYNNTSQQTTVTVPGDGATSGQEVTVNLSLTRVKFHNSGNVTYYSGGWRTISGDNYYMFPGERRIYFRNNYSRNVNITGTNFERAAAIIVLKDHEGNPTAINSIRGGNGNSIGWHVGNVNGGNHVSIESNSVWIDISAVNTNTSRTYEVTKNRTISTQTQNLLTNNLFNFQTNLLTLRLQKCNGDGIEGGGIRAGYSSNLSANLNASNISFHWNQNEVTSNTTDANGNTSVEAFPGKFYIEMKTGASTQDKQIEFTGNDTVTWTTTNVKLNYAGQIAYGKSSITGFFTKPSMELLPGNLKFSFRNNGENIVDIDVPENGCNYEKTAVLVRLINSTNQPIADANTGYHQGGNWRIPIVPLTQANGNAISLLDGNVTTGRFRVTHNHFTSEVNNVNLASVNHVVIFKTENVQIQLRNSQNAPLQGTGAQHHAGGNWRTFGGGNTDINGNVNDELLPGTYRFRIAHNHFTQEKQNVAIDANNKIVLFQTNLVTLELQDSDGDNTLEGNTVQHHAGGNWRTFGNGETTNGVVTDELFSGTYRFRMTHNYTTKEFQGVAIDENNNHVVFQTEKVTVQLRDSDNNPIEGETAQHHAGGNWRTFGDGYTTNGDVSDQLFSGTYRFRLTHNFVSKELQNVAIPENTHTTVPFQTMLTKVALKGFNNSNVEVQLTEGVNIQYHAGGNWRNYGVNNNTSNNGEAELQLFAGAYRVRMTLNHTTQEINTHDFVNDATATFNASRVYVIGEYPNHVGGTAQYHAGGNWRTIGTLNTSATSPYVYMLPGSYNFRITGAGPTATKNAVSVAPPVEYVTFAAAAAAMFDFNISEVSLYPNPATEYVTVKVPVNNSVIEIYSIDGRKVQHINATSYINNVEINRLVAGTYKMVVTYEGKREVVSFVKQ